MKPVKFTIATVSFNAESLIERTIRSVEGQTYPWIEHLIVDGNSQDETLAYVHHYQERNSLRSQPRDIICRSENDEGLYDAMNKALDLASGDYILFLNAGDKLNSKECLAQVAQKIEEVEDDLPAVVYGYTNLVDKKGNFLRPRRLAPPAKLTWKSFKRGMLVCHQAFFARTDLAKRQPYDLRYKYSADFDWCVRILHEAALKNLSTLKVPFPVADYLDDPEVDSLTNQHHKASLQERFNIMRHHYGWLSTTVHHLGFVLRNFTLK